MGALSIALIAIGVFATTNVDDLLVLAGFFSDKRLVHWQVVAGQVLGIGALVAASLAAALIAFVVSPAYVGLLGIVPLIIGVAKLRSLDFSFSTGNGGKDNFAKGANLKAAGMSGVAAVFNPALPNSSHNWRHRFLSSGIGKRRPVEGEASF